MEKDLKDSILFIDGARKWWGLPYKLKGTDNLKKTNTVKEVGKF